MADQDSVIDSIMETRRRLRERLAREPHPLLDVNLTMPQLKVMVVLSGLGATSGQELARRTGASLATLTGVVDRLVAHGLVARYEDARDRRVRRLELTPAGSELIDRLLAAEEDHHRRLLRRLDADRLALVAEAFELLLDATGSATDSATGSATDPAR